MPQDDGASYKGLRPEGHIGNQAAVRRSRVYSVPEVEAAVQALGVLNAGVNVDASGVAIVQDAIEVALRIVATGLAEMEAEHARANQAVSQSDDMAARQGLLGRYQGEFREQFKPAGYESCCPFPGCSAVYTGTDRPETQFACARVDGCPHRLDPSVRPGPTCR